MKKQYIYIDDRSNKFYYSDKSMTVRHREDGPAVEWANGSKAWFINGKRHREDGPAIEDADGLKAWFINGEEGALPHDLFACPFCGAKAKHDEEETYSLDSSYEYIGCTKCPAQIPIGNTKEEAVKQWNLRANAQAQVPLSQT